MKNLVFSLILTVLCFNYVFSQTDEYSKAFDYLKNKGEVYFTFTVNSLDEISTLTKIISIDNVKQKDVYAYANEKEFNRFLDLNYNYHVLTPAGDMIKNPAMMTSLKKGVWDWDEYPTYEVYCSMMDTFEILYPDICEIIDIGVSVEGRRIIYAKISDNVSTNEAEPRFNYTSTMHGDETTGYILMLRLIDHLLSNYGTDPEATFLVDNIEIWINPCSNPDGTYAGGNHTVNGATRNNANNVDLNRNYPDFTSGDHPDGEDWQPENILMMDLADSIHFVLTSNIHTGAEVVNYPWDTQSTLHPDDDWWQLVSRCYADTVHLYSSGNYMTGYNDGITNGYAWYEINGGRADYFGYYKHWREFTLELSSTKLPPAGDMPMYWNYNNRSLISYMAEVVNGVHGIITDSLTGEPLEAMVFIDGHDFDNSHVYSELPFGDYYRLLYEGTYDITYSCDGYQSKTLTVNIVNHDSTRQDVQLVSLEFAPPEADFSATPTSTCNSTVTYTNETVTGLTTTYLWDFGDGETSVEEDPVHNYAGDGIYTVILTATNAYGTDVMTKTNYITIEGMPEPPVTQSAAICEDEGSVMLSATGSGTLNWYDQYVGGTLLHTGPTFTTPVLTETTTYYVENGLINDPGYVGKEDNSGDGSYYNYSESHYLIFDCYTPLTLVSVKVYAQTDGNRTISLRDGSGSLIESATVFINEGESRIDLNLEVPVGNNLRLQGPSQPRLYRNSNSTDYPYDLNGMISIHDNSADDLDYYYFFYDWEVKEADCVSDRTPVSAIINNMPVADFSWNDDNGSVEFTNLSQYSSTYLWFFGDGDISNDTDPVHQYDSSGDYTVTMIAANACGADTVDTVITVVVTGIEDNNNLSDINIFPNPASGSFTIEYSFSEKEKVNIKICDLTGNIFVERIENPAPGRHRDNFDLSGISKGIYIIHITTEKQSMVRKIVVE